MVQAKCNRCGGTAIGDTFEEAKSKINHAVGLTRSIPCGDNYNRVVEVLSNKPDKKSNPKPDTKPNPKPDKKQPSILDKITKSKKSKTKPSNSTTSDVSSDINPSKISPSDSTTSESVQE